LGTADTAAPESIEIGGRDNGAKSVGREDPNTNFFLSSKIMLPDFWNHTASKGNTYIQGSDSGRKPI
jgi:hypothetical protein